MTNAILSGPETDPEILDELMACVRRQEPTVISYESYDKL